MRDWRSMTTSEKEEARAGRGAHANKVLMDNTLRRTLALLEGDAKATARAWKIAWGCHLVNTAEDIAAYCREVAVC